MALEYCDRRNASLPHQGAHILSFTLLKRCSTPYPFVQFFPLEKSSQLCVPPSVWKMALLQRLSALFHEFILFSFPCRRRTPSRYPQLQWLPQVRKRVSDFVCLSYTDVSLYSLPQKKYATVDLSRRVFLFLIVNYANAGSFSQWLVWTHGAIFVSPRCASVASVNDFRAIYARAIRMNFGRTSRRHPLFAGIDEVGRVPRKWGDNKLSQGTLVYVYNFQLVHLAARCERPRPQIMNCRSFFQVSQWMPGENMFSLRFHARPQ